MNISSDVVWSCVTFSLHQPQHKALLPFRNRCERTPSAAPWQLRLPYDVYTPTVLLHVNTALIQAAGP